MHYDPIEGKTRDDVKDIIDILFPETKKIMFTIIWI